jgi:hypothetical protein
VKGISDFTSCKVTGFYRIIIFYNK